MNPKEVQVPKESKQVFSVYVPEKFGGSTTIAKLEAIADREDRSLNYIVCQALVEYIEKQGASKPSKKAKKAASSPDGKG